MPPPKPAAPAKPAAAKPAVAKPTPGGGPMTVRATARGFYRLLREPGDVFEIKDTGHFSATWMAEMKSAIHKAEQAAGDAPKDPPAPPADPTKPADPPAPGGDGTGNQSVI